MVSQPGQWPIPPGSAHYKVKKRCNQKNYDVYRSQTQRCLDDRELNQARSKPDTVDRPVITARTFVHHYNSTQYHNTDSFSIFPFLLIKITSQMWPSAGKGKPLVSETWSVDILESGLYLALSLCPPGVKVGRNAPEHSSGAHQLLLVYYNIMRVG